MDKFKDEHDVYTLNRKGVVLTNDEVSLLRDNGFEPKSHEVIEWQGTDGRMYVFVTYQNGITKNDSALLMAATRRFIKDVVEREGLSGAPRVRFMKACRACFLSILEDEELNYADFDLRMTNEGDFEPWMNKRGETFNHLDEGLTLYKMYGFDLRYEFSDGATGCQYPHMVEDIKLITHFFHRCFSKPDDIEDIDIEDIFVVVLNHHYLNTMREVSNAYNRTRAAERANATVIA